MGGLINVYICYTRIVSSGLSYAVFLTCGTADFCATRELEIAGLWETDVENNRRAAGYLFSDPTGLYW